MTTRLAPVCELFPPSNYCEMRVRAESLLIIRGAEIRNLLGRTGRHQKLDQIIICCGRSGLLVVPTVSV